MTAATVASTHEVFNQSPPFTDINLYSSDNGLRAAVAREGCKRAAKSLTRFGKIAGSAHSAELARLANEYTPVLRQFDSSGRRVDTIEYHPAWHELMSISARQRLHCSSWPELTGRDEAADHPNVTRAAGFYMAAQMESGHTCPITMSNAVVPALRKQDDLAAEWLPQLAVADYDPAFKPAPGKRAITFGMGMTEKQGGTDVRTNTTEAMPAGTPGPGQEYLLTGHKWFMSAPMCDAFLVLAQAPGGLSCFLMPRFLPDGRQNPLIIQRLKDKLGNRSNASSEVEFAGTHAWMVGEEGRGVATIIEMVTYTRLDCAISSAAMMRQALAHAIHHTEHRVVFQRKLIDQPLMRQVLADMALDQEAALMLVFRVARAFDGASDDAYEAAVARFLTPAVKFWVCKALPGIVNEALECLGGNGYVESGPMARLYREAPLNAIWEGSGNVMCLDMLRAIAKAPEDLQMLFDGLVECGGREARISNAVQRLRERFANPSGLEADMRYVMEKLVHTAAACLLLKHAPQAHSDAFIASRLRGPYRHTYGSLRGADIGSILDWARPDL